MVAFMRATLGSPAAREEVHLPALFLDQCVDPSAPGPRLLHGPHPRVQEGVEVRHLVTALRRRLRRTQRALVDAWQPIGLSPSPCRRRRSTRTGPARQPVRLALPDRRSEGDPVASSRPPVPEQNPMTSAVYPRPPRMSSVHSCCAFQSSEEFSALDTSCTALSFFAGSSSPAARTSAVACAGRPRRAAPGRCGGGWESCRWRGDRKVSYRPRGRQENRRGETSYGRTSDAVGRNGGAPGWVIA